MSVRTGMSAERTDASGGRISGKVTAVALCLMLAGCGMGSAVGGTVGAAAGGAVDLLLRDGGAPSDLEALR